MRPARSLRSLRNHSWELRAQVQESSFSYLDKQAALADRPRALHAGRVLDAYAQASQEMTSAENAKLDPSFTQPHEFLALLREGLKKVS